MLEFGRVVSHPGYSLSFVPIHLHYISKFVQLVQHLYAIYTVENNLKFNYNFIN